MHISVDANEFAGVSKEVGDWKLFNWGIMFEKCKRRSVSYVYEDFGNVEFLFSFDFDNNVKRGRKVRVKIIIIT